MSIATVVLIVIILVLLFGFVPIGGDDVRPGRQFYGQGPFLGGGLGLVVVVLLILLLLGKI